MITENSETENIEDELFEHYHFEVSTGQSPLRIDKYLMGLVQNATRNKIQKATECGCVLVNDYAVKSNYKVKPNDIIRVVFDKPKYQYKIIPENIPLDIVYEDHDLLVINKKAGFVVHPGHGNYSGTLVNALAYHFDKLPLNSSQRPGLVHRIDKDTTGLLVIAKTEEAMFYLAKQFEEKTSEREYIALVWGNFEQNEGTITGYIGRHPKDRMQMAIFEDENSGKWSVTHYKVIERFNYVTLVSCHLETGRTHQIRASMKHIGHPLFNDSRYGGDRIIKGTTFTKYKQFVENCFKILPRQALHAKTLGFIHPTTKKNLRFNTELPEDIQNIIEKWRNYIG